MSFSAKLIPAAIAARLAFTSARTGAGWVRFAQWDAVAVHLALAAVFGGASVAIARR
ncbi:hypothetical protein [Novosphingobium huizhouense]|uniref:hypothetical protein n=1 Tax=Novosphingobium huizhouense TaxID=2866625 RepID=UPI001CD8B1C9|nr:hypothetical protein [Novosphingobium huizhouense]